jgi:hypothetical protein
VVQVRSPPDSAARWEARQATLYVVGHVRARTLPAQTEVTVKGVHFVQEDSPDEIGRTVKSWMKTLG